MKNKLTMIKEELNNSKRKKKNISNENFNSKDLSYRNFKQSINMKNSEYNLQRNKETIYSKYESQNSYLLSSENSMGDKKITIKDLCPEEKARIGELIKKLAQEKDEKESLRLKLEAEKKEYESRIESISKENISMLENSKIYQNNDKKLINETVNEKSCNTDENKSPIVDIKNLREKFNKVYEDLQNSVKVQEDMINSRANFGDSINNQSMNILNNNSSILKEEKPQNDPFIKNFNIKNNEENFPQDVERELNLNFNYKKDNNQKIIHDILNNNNQTDYLNSLNSPKMSVLNVEENYYNPSPNERFPNNVKIVDENSSPRKLQSSLLNFNDEIRENNNKNRRTKDINDEIINNIQIQKQKQSFLISKNKLQNVNEKMKHITNPLEDQEHFPNNDKHIITRSQKNNINQETSNLQESQKKLIGSYLQFNVKRVQDVENDNQDSNRSRSISQLNKNIKKFEYPQKKYSNDYNLNEEEDSDVKVVHFYPKNEYSQNSINKESRSNSKTKYQEMLCRIKEKCQNTSYYNGLDENSNNEDINRSLLNKKQDSYNIRINKTVGSDTEDQDIPSIDKCKTLTTSKLKSFKYEIDKPVDILLSSQINNYRKEDKHSIQIELSSSSYHYQNNQTCKVRVDEEDENMIALLNPSKEGSNQYFNSLNENNRENRFKSEKFVSNNSEDGQKNSVCFDNKFLNLIEEMENLEVSIKNNNAKLNLFENSSSTSQILKSLNQIEKDVDNINLLSMKFSPQKITEIPKKSNEIKRTKQHITLIENNTEKVFKKKMNMLEELKKLNYNYD